VGSAQAQRQSAVLGSRGGRLTCNASLKDIRDRIGSVKNTQKITDAMKLVAAAKVRKDAANHSHKRLKHRKKQTILPSPLNVQPAAAFLFFFFPSFGFADLVRFFFVFVCLSCEFQR
jgi:hypothetical protein